MRLSVSPLLFLFLPLTSTSLFSFALARGGERTSSSASLTGRHLVEEGVSKPPVDLEKGYMTNDELENAVISFGERCSNISRIYSIGRSVNGFPLWVVEISDNPGKEEPEPAFKFVGNVHGDEPVGRELLILLANWLCDNYLKDPLATQIVKNIHLHMLPSMNPDGFSLKRRGNANNIDLNRDFPDQFFDMDDVVARQPETKAVMLWSQRTRFTASASLHGVLSSFCLLIISSIICIT
ncbi:suppressor of los1-1 [Dionaea muscipula]